jgi:multimeric flavodoxin WrbA
MNKILVLKSSPRSKGNSSTLAGQAIAAAKEAGAHVDVFDLHQLDIRPCDACESCRVANGVCAIGDDMQDIYPKLRRADGILLASPIYWFTFSAQLKACIDRWYALGSGDVHELAGKKFAILLTYGDSDPFNSGAVNAIYTFRSMFDYIGAEIVGIVYGSASDIGDVQKQPDLMHKAYQLGRTLLASSSG